LSGDQSGQARVASVPAPVLRLGVQRQLDVLGRRSVCHRERLDAEVDGLASEFAGLGAGRGERGDRELAPTVINHLKCLGADGTGRTDNGDTGDHSSIISLPSYFTSERSKRTRPATLGTTTQMTNATARRSHCSPLIQSPPRNGRVWRWQIGRAHV